MSDFGHKIENPLFLFSLFEKGIYCIDKDVELLNGLNNKTLGSELQGDETVLNSKPTTPNSLQEIPSKSIPPPVETAISDAVVNSESTTIVSPEQVANSHHQQTENNLAAEIKQTVQILNLFFDPADNPMQAAAMEAYPKLMQAIKLNGENLQTADFAMIGLHQSAIMKSLISEKSIAILPEIWKEFNSKFVIIWTNRRLTSPNLEHFQMIDYHGVSLILLPSFSTMLGNVELKKRVWINMKNLLGFV